MLRLRSLLVLATLSALPLFTPAQATIVSGPAEVVDGDTLRIGANRIRLHGIDAPERRQSCPVGDGRDWACGAWASGRLAALTRGRHVACTAVDRDRYGRLVARCRAAGRDLGAAMVAEGAALAYRRYSQDYVAAERQAAGARRGIWQRGRISPEAFRAGQHRKTQAAARPGCAIKGNISASGRIYHLPGQQHYDRTRIAQAKGERWFCSEAEARAAGWRRAKR